jgi:hypothetical protein
MNESNTFTISLLIAIVSVIVSVVYYGVSELKSIETNVQSAIEKGIDPIAVRCAYANQTDVVCVAYASAHPSAVPTPVPPVKSGK